jgi:hypothetical protein
MSSRSQAFPYIEQGFDAEPYLIRGFILNSFVFSNGKRQAIEGE